MPIALVEDSTDSLDPQFVAGFVHELNGRAIMRAASPRMAARFAGEPMQQLWAADQRLEEFNWRRYQPVVEALGIAEPDPRWIAVKAAAFACLPRFILPAVLARLRERTIVYVETLRALGARGPAQHAHFHAYMVRQEALQVQMVALALVEDYTGAAALVDAFIAEESALLVAPPGS